MSVGGSETGRALFCGFRASLKATQENWALLYEVFGGIDSGEGAESVIR